MGSKKLIGKQDVVEVHITSIEEYDTLVHFLSMSDLRDTYFRGQKEATWSLEPKIKRKVVSNQFNYETWVEEKLITDIKNDIHHYRHQLLEIPEKKDYLEYLSLIQHYGGSTRLLDLSRSFFKALYFATSETFDLKGTAKCVIWVFNFGKNKFIFQNHKGAVEKRTHEFSAVDEFNRIFKSYYQKTEKNKISSDNLEYKSGIGLVESRIKNPRLLKQQSVFAFGLNFAEPLEENLNSILTHSLSKPIPPEDLIKFARRKKLPFLSKIVLEVSPKFKKYLENSFQLLDLTLIDIYPEFVEFIKFKGRQFNSKYQTELK